MSEPNIQVPAALIAMAYEIDKWFKQQGFDTYCLGPICSRDYANECEASMARSEAQREALSCLDETDSGDCGPTKPHPKGGIYRKPANDLSLPNPSEPLSPVQGEKGA